jgi:hypothetical protein
MHRLIAQTFPLTRAGEGAEVDGRGPQDIPMVRQQDTSMPRRGTAGVNSEVPFRISDKLWHYG